ncbi:acyl-CoA dehydrogenase family protein [Nocardia vinacea]|uniref:Acyl-CoA dehydrogenase family protein n=1 Tax=Nocardia vinacea TaxID=96468 RepID=A0ABZ1YXH9_9NOCA|nr:acyl-CoA dehydrogenase family protein [Nocardia vinacea]
MAWDFETDPEFAEQLAWIDGFVRDEIEPIDLLIDDPWDVRDPLRNDLIVPLQDEVKKRELWACHLGPELGGQGYGQVKLALMNELLGRSLAAPIVFGTQAPDSGNSEILAHYGTAEQKQRYLEPLLDGRIVSCFSMTEPHGGADPEVFTTRAELDGDEWVINGEKWFSSNAAPAAFFIVMAVTDPDAQPYRRQSMFIVPAETPGIEILRNVEGHHAYIRYTDVRVPSDHILGARGEAFVVAQTRLGGGRIHHAMRTIGLARHCLDLMCRRALSRHTQGETLADKQLVRAAIAESWCQIESFRLLVLRTAWKIDRYQDYKRLRGDISAVKAMMPKVLHEVASRALQIHGSIGTTAEMPFLGYVRDSYTMALADGPTEVHLTNLARALLRNYQADTDTFPDYHIPRRRQEAEEKFRLLLDKHARSV